jgi:hypothetical protein
VYVYISKIRLGYSFEKTIIKDILTKTEVIKTETSKKEKILFYIFKNKQKCFIINSEHYKHIYKQTGEFRW